MKLIRVSLALVVAMLAGPSWAWSQSATTAAIAGTVRDATGGVLPGVTVEASSPALIEKVRTVVTDNNGEYKIIDLRPGTYAVTFALTGFNTVRREGIELSTGFTATIPGELTVGSLAETITVSGATPLVDVQNSRTQQVLKSEVLESLPSASKDLTQYASLTLGAVASVQGRNDVGGDRGEQNTGIVLHGGRGDDGRVNYDGMGTNVPTGSGGGQHRIYHFNTIGVQEVVLDTGGNSAETETGGANVNMVPRDGGNRFSLISVDNFTTAGLASGRVPDNLIARGSRPDQKSVKKIWDYGVGVGGPVLRDKLWFFSANRWWGAQNPGANNFFNKSTNPLFYVADLDRPAYTDNWFRDFGGRLTWQPTAKHRVRVSENYNKGCSCWLAIGSGALSSPEAAISYVYGPIYATQGTWTYTPTNRLLIQGGLSILKQPEDFTSFPAPLAGATSILEQSTGYRYGAPLPSTSLFAYANRVPQDNYDERVSAAYVTGSHSVKVGLQMFQLRYEPRAFPPPVTYTFRNQQPVSLSEWAGPLAVSAQSRNVAIYAQDQWTTHRFTFNYGLRFDHFWAFAPALTKPAGLFMPETSFPAVEDTPNFKDLSPRVGVSYDLFGNGKTAIKASWGRYLLGQGLSATAAVIPANSISTTTNRTWDDQFFGAGDPRSGNYLPDCTLPDPAANGECGGIDNARFGQVVPNLSWADDAREGWGVREYNYQITTQLQHEIRPGLSVAVGYFRTWWGNFTATQNTLVTPGDFTEYCITAPTDARLGATSGQQLCGLYDVRREKFGQVNRLITLASNFGTQREVFNGVDMGFTARFWRGSLLQGGVTLGRTTTDNCYANAYPNVTPQNAVSATNNQPRTNTFCHIESPLWSGVGSQIKVQGVYPLPGAFQLSGTYKNLPGIPDLANYVATNAIIAPSLGQNLSSCTAATGACTASVTIPIIPYGTNGSTSSGTVFDDRLNETDLRLARNFRFGQFRVQATADLYNVFNQRPVQGINSTYGGTWLTPTSILGGRVLRFGGQFEF